jgi:hypothetical protein
VLLHLNVVDSSQKSQVVHNCLQWKNLLAIILLTRFFVVANNKIEFDQ